MTTLSEVSSVAAPAGCGTRSLLRRRVVRAFILSLALGCSESDAASHGLLGDLGGAGGTMTSGGSGGGGPTAGGTSGSAEAGQGAVGLGGNSGRAGASGSGGSNEAGTSSAAVSTDNIDFFVRELGNSAERMPSVVLKSISWILRNLGQCLPNVLPFTNSPFSESL